MYVALEKIRSLYNVGSIFRSCSFFGINKVVLVGYSGKRPLPNGSWEINSKVSKTSLGAEKDLVIKEVETAKKLIKWIRRRNYRLIVAEQSRESIPLKKWVVEENDVVVVGNEVDGVSSEILDAADVVVEIERKGKKGSLNVAIAAGVIVHKMSESCS